jgi:hypothetical protein
MRFSYEFVANFAADMCHINEEDPSSNYCVSGDTQWPCYPGQGYFGRGPLQLSWNFNVLRGGGEQPRLRRAEGPGQGGAGPRAVLQVGVCPSSRRSGSG